MEKDPNTLTAISPKFTEEVLRKILHQITKNNNAELIGWNILPGAVKGNNYLSVVYRIILHGRINENNSQFSIIVKTLPKNERTRKVLLADDFFKNEIAFYTQVVPLYKEFVRSKGKSDLLHIPKCYAHLDDGKNNYLALEDMKAKGFDHRPRRKAWGVEDCKIVFRALAQFHAIGLALWRQRPLELTDAVKHLFETLYSEKIWLTTSVVNIAKDAVTKEYSGTPLERKFNSVTPRELFRSNIERVERKERPTWTVTHGDCWTTNFMFRETNSGGQDAAIFDFQQARCGSPVYDLGFIIYASTNKRTRDEHFHDLLKVYHVELAKTLSALGSSISEIYPWDLFMNEVKEGFAFGFVCSLFVLPTLLLPLSEAYDLDNVRDDDGTDVSDIWKLKPIEDRENRKRAADVVVHAIDEGFVCQVEPELL